MDIKVDRSVKFGDYLLMEDCFFGGQIVATLRKVSTGWRAGLNPDFCSRHGLETQEIIDPDFDVVVDNVEDLVSDL